MNTQSNPDVKFFNLHTVGIGYLNRVRAVAPKKGHNFVACTIAALRGDAEDKLYTKFDVIIKGAEAECVIERYCSITNEKTKDGKSAHKVLIGFRVGDTYPEAFTFNRKIKLDSGKVESREETGLVIKGRLLKIFWVKVDGVKVYQAPQVVVAAPAATTAEVPADSAVATSETAEEFDDGIDVAEFDAWQDRKFA